MSAAVSTTTIHLNGTPRPIAAEATVADLLAELKLPGSLVAVEVNARLVPRGEHANCALRAGDRVEIVTLVGGG